MPFPVKPREAKLFTRAYVRERSRLVEDAVMIATLRVRDPAIDKDRGRAFTRCFSAVMEEFSVSLLRSNNGAGEHRAA